MSNRQATDKQEKSNPAKISMADLLAATGYKIPVLKRGQEVAGKIVFINKDEILIDIGAKSEGIVTGRELSMVHDLASSLSLGETVEAVVV